MQKHGQRRPQPDCPSHGQLGGWGLVCR